MSSKTNTLNPFLDAEFNVTCLQYCEHLNYTWEFSPNSEKIIYKDHNVSTTIPKLTFEDKQQVLVTVHSRKGKAELSVVYTTPPGYIIITCVNKNCPYANPLKPSEFSLTCFFDCEDQDWVWDIEPRDPNFNWTNNIKTDTRNTTLTILPEAFVDGQVVQLNAYADGSTYLHNKTVIKFEEPTPNVTITCVKNCKPVSPMKDVDLKMNCLDNCDRLVYEWTLEPKSAHVLLDNNNGSDFKIKAGSYYFNETVIVLLKVRKARVNFTISFGAAGWDGVCFVEPNGGTSGVTLFAVGCDSFQDGVTYRVYQDYGSGLGVLLTFGQSKFQDYVYLSAGKGLLTVVVGNGFEAKKRVKLKLGTVKKLPEASSLELFRKIMGEGENDFGGMVNSGVDVHKTVQFASLLWTALEGVVDAAHYNKHIISGMTLF